MLIRSNFAERRQHYRFKVKEGAVAGFHKPLVFKLVRSFLAKYAKIVDLSKGGLSFQYKSRDMWPHNFSQLSISIASDKIKITDLPFRVVKDFSISRVAGSKSIRRCGVKFGELTPLQKYQLHYFIQSNTNYRRPVDRRVSKDRRQSVPSESHVAERRRGAERRKKLLKR